MLFRQFYIRKLFFGAFYFQVGSLRIVFLLGTWTGNKYRRLGDYTIASCEGKTQAGFSMLPLISADLNLQDLEDRNKRAPAEIPKPEAVIPKSRFFVGVAVKKALNNLICVIPLSLRWLPCSRDLC